MAAPADLAVVGGGPAGYGAALRATRRGLSAVLIEEDAVGGVCLNRGCIPSKAMLHAAHLLDSLHNLDGDAAVDLARVRRHREESVARLRAGVEGLLRSAGVEVVKGRGTLCDDGVLVRDRGSGERVVEAKHVLLATGSADRPLLPGIERSGVIDSDGALALERPPERLVVAGGGPVGCEWAAVFAAFGSAVTLLEGAATLLPLESEELGRGLEAALIRQGVEVRTGTAVEAIEEGGDALVVTAGGESLPATFVLLALGRVARTADLGLEGRGVTRDERGFVAVDERLRTSGDGVSAAGDVTGHALLAHVATHQAAVAVDRLAGLDARTRYHTVPSVTYTHPEVASVGLTEVGARDAGHEVRSARVPLQALGRAAAIGETEGFVRLIADASLGQLLGAQILAPAAGELIAEVALAIGLEATLDDIADTVHAHPTFAEGIFEAALSALGLEMHVPARPLAVTQGGLA
jgi:dihydrolipoamide dehydrogenase